MPSGTLTIDPEFKNLIPPLTKEAYDGLEQKILAEGFDAERYGALTTWNGILVDGHNRYEICCKHHVQFKTLEMDFKSRDDVKLWIYMKHIGQRNLTSYQIGLIVLKIEPMIKAKAKENQIVRKGNQPGATSQKSAELSLIETAKELEKLSGISHDTIFKVRKIEQEATPEQKRRLSTGEAKVNAIYREIRPKGVKLAMPKPAKLETRGKEDKKISTELADIEDTYNSINISQFRLIINTFLHDMTPFVYMDDRYPLTPEADKTKMLEEIGYVEDVIEKIKKMTKGEL
ncbi:MAG: hypothetical protein WC365_05805 [Candidatus Babeliales bacterium]|jgi:hypothetical protein